MQIIKLTHNDINEMVQKAIRSLMNESIEEVQGSAMAEKEDIIQKIVEYVEREWDKIKNEGGQPKETGAGILNVPDGPKEKVNYAGYVILIPHSLTKGLNIAEQMDINVGIRDITVPDRLMKYFASQNERGTEGTSYSGSKYGEYLKPKMMIRRGRIDLTVPAINGELQIQGLYSTMYHELNHNASNLRLKNIMATRDNVDQEALNNMDMFQASMRDDFPHGLTVPLLNQKSPFYDFLDSMTFGDDKKYLRDMSFIFYGLWEITERNARAESIYGDLQGMRATRATFKDAYLESAVYRDISDFRDALGKMETISPDSMIWDYAAKIMNMSPRGRSINKWDDESRARFNIKVKRRFLKRSYELIEILYKKSMKVAALYFQRQEEGEQDKPGGGLDRLNQLLNTD